ncbi:MAG: biotin transporter BioY [Lachnospiraceae bacterium]|nr:biotin transporter BioY [Lachnospiraceae bacterium]
MNTVKSPTLSAGTSDRRFSTRDLVLAGMFAAVMTVISQISLPMPTGVPITIQVFGVALIGVVLGWRLGVFSLLVYVLLGAVGLPVFANFHGGFSSLVGLTGGYIWSWPIMAAFCGIEPPFKNQKTSFAVRILLALIGLAIVETVGGLQWAALSADMGVKAVFLYSIVGFVPKDILITVLAVVIGLSIRKSIRGIAK